MATTPDSHAGGPGSNRSNPGVAPPTLEPISRIPRLQVAKMRQGSQKGWCTRKPSTRDDKKIIGEFRAHLEEGVKNPASPCWADRHSEDSARSCRWLLQVGSSYIFLNKSQTIVFLKKSCRIPDLAVLPSLQQHPHVRRGGGHGEGGARRIQPCRQSVHPGGQISTAPDQELGLHLQSVCKYFFK